MHFAALSVNSTLKKHLKAKHPSQFEEIRTSKLELLDSPLDESGSSEENGRTDMKNRLHIKDMEISQGLQLTLKDSLGTKSNKNFTC